MCDFVVGIVLVHTVQFMFNVCALCVCVHVCVCVYVCV